VGRVVHTTERGDWGMEMGCASLPRKLLDFLHLEWCIFARSGMLY